MAKKSVPVSGFIHTTHLWVQNWIFSICKLQKRRFILISQNDLTANVLRNVCNNDKIETRVPLVTGKNLENKTANRSNEARFDIESRWF